jgi:hypothetical protein
MRHAALLVIGNCAKEKAYFEAQEGPPAQFAEPVTSRRNSFRCFLFFECFAIMSSWEG